MPTTKKESEVKENTIFYIKEGRRYKPVHEYDQTLMDSFPKGSHLVVCYPGGQSRRFNIDPAYAPMIAAGRVAEDAISNALMKANDLRPQTRPITPAAQRAWMKLKKELGNEAMLTRGSTREASEAAVKAMMEEADKLLANPTVRKAYEKFLFLAELTKDHTNEVV
jgi:hypothetical protein